MVGFDAMPVSNNYRGFMCTKVAPIFYSVSIVRDHMTRPQRFGALEFCTLVIGSSIAPHHHTERRKSYRVGLQETPEPSLCLLRREA